MAPLGGHLAPQGPSGGLRAKNVHFPMGKLTSFFFQNSLPYFGKSDNSENAQKSKIIKKNDDFLGNVSFTPARSNILVVWRRPKKCVNGGVRQVGFHECVFYQSETQCFEKEAIRAKT